MRKLSDGRAAIFPALLAWFLCVGGGGVCSAQPARTESEEGSLAARVDEFERNEKELAAATASLAGGAGGLTAPERSRLARRVSQLQARQAVLLQELERLAGPLPPAVRRETPSPPEEQQESRRQRDDAILEKDVERRLP